MTQSDVTFYLGTIASVIVIFGTLWKATVGQALKDLERRMVTKEDLLKELIDLREFLRKEFVQKRR